MANTPKVQRPRRTSINGVRNVLSVTGTEPGFVYRFVNDTGDRVAQFQEAGYEIVTDLPLKTALAFPILSNISTSCMDLVWPRCGH